MLPYHRLLRVRQEHHQPPKVVMSVALDVRDTEARHDRDVLQQGHGAHAGKVFAALDIGPGGVGAAVGGEQGSVSGPLMTPLQFLWLVPA